VILVRKPLEPKEGAEKFTVPSPKTTIPNQLFAESLNLKELRLISLIKLISYRLYLKSTCQLSKNMLITNRTTKIISNSPGKLNCREIKR
jgi:hypothetical protein